VRSKYRCSSCAGRTFDSFAGAQRTAVKSSLKMVTHNVADFEPMGVYLVNPWE
jgi:predicted nucleic acid-binding protein